MRWITRLFRKRKLEAQLDAELCFHIEQRTADLIANGVAPAEARRRALVEFGGLERAKEECRQARGTYFLESVLTDIRYAFRTLRKSPGFTLVAILTLALGIGANTAIFSAINGILLKPLPYLHPSRLVSISGYKRWNVAGGNVMGIVSFTSDVWRQLRQQAPSIEQMALCRGEETTLTGGSAPEIIRAAYVSADFFPLLGVRPLIGRPILPSDLQPGAKPVAVASYALWRSRWGSSATAPGRTIILDGKRFTLIGVMPPEFDFGFHNHSNGVWLPDTLPSQIGAGLPQSAVAVARLTPGATPAALNAQLKTISPRFSKDFSVFGGGGHFQCTPLAPNFSDIDTALLILWGAVGLVLLIACANVSGLLLSRGWSRQREVAIRDALGATRARLARQFLTESMLLALAGGALGILLCAWCVHVLRVITPADAPEHGKFLLNMNILWFALAVSLLTGVLFGLAPALQSSSRRVGAALKEGLGGSLAGASAKKSRKLHGALVILEVALAVVLVVGATLLGRSLEKLIGVNLGFRTDHVVTMTANFSKSVCDDSGTRKGFAGCWSATKDALDRIRAISGVQSAAVASTAPLAGWSVLLQLRVQGQPREISVNRGELIAQRRVSSDYFRTLGIRLLSGRGFTDADVNGSRPVAIVDRAFAEKYLDDKPLGKHISITTKNPPQWLEVVGEVSDTHDANLNDKPLPEIFFPAGQGSYVLAGTFIARTSVNPEVMIPALQQAIWSVDKNAPVTGVKTMNQIVSASVAQPRFQALLLGAFGFLGLILAPVGIYGVISYGVTQRTHEIGIRIALGAQTGDVFRLVVGQGTKLVLAGVAIGLGASFAATRLMRSLLYGISATDPLTFVAVSILLLLAGLLACYLPARRAMRVDPVVALRQE